MGVNGFNGLNLALVCRHGWPRPDRDSPVPPCKVCVAYGRAYIEPEPDPTAPSAVWSPYPIGKIDAVAATRGAPGRPMTAEEWNSLPDTRSAVPRPR